jgi:hypothetical protein
MEPADTQNWDDGIWMSGHMFNGEMVEYQQYPLTLRQVTYPRGGDSRGGKHSQKEVSNKITG